jgi:hypothetical protein
VSPLPYRTTKGRKAAKPATAGQPRLADLFNGVAETLATLAGLAVFVYVIGGLSVLARLDRLKLPAEAVIPEVPRERLALLGLAQLLWTLVLGGAIAALALWLLPTLSPGESWSSWGRRLLREEKRKWIPAAVLLLVIILIAPWSVNGVIYLVLLLAGIAWFIVNGTERPLVGALLVLLVAGALTVLRELEFPGRFTRAEVTLTRESVSDFPEAVRDVVKVNLRLKEARSGALEAEKARAIEQINARMIDEKSARVIATTPEEVLIGFEGRKQQKLEEESMDRLPPALVVIPRDSVARLRYEIPDDPASHSNSIAQELVGMSPPPLPLMCLIPSCEWDENGDKEVNEPAWSAPFVF